jgi:Asp-tRNA(Asn)/Glu-tRNA(Gln) amidotransferase A subunit family amidase
MAKLNPSDITAAEASARMTAGELTSLAYVDACLARVAEREADVQAWVHLDPEAVRAAARAADERRREGRAAGPLNGIPVGIKDVIATADMPTQNGCAAFKGHQPERDAGCVAQLRGAGAIILGKTVTTELATHVPNKTRNPHNTAHTPGGSSSGSAAAVACGMVPLALGTQTGGSVIRPASFCGIHGIKPTLGLISRTGVTMQSHTLDTVGVYGRSLDDLALGVDAMGAFDPADDVSYARPRPSLTRTLAEGPAPTPTLAFFRSPAWAKVEPAAAAAIERFAKALGDRVVEVEMPAFDGIVAHHSNIMEAEKASHYGPLLAASPDGISPSLAERIRYGATVPAHTYIDSLRASARAYVALEETLSRYAAILTLSSCGPAPEGLGSTGNAIFNGLWTLLGVPCVSLPLMTVGGMPCGVQLVGLRRDEGRLLRVARWVEENAERITV